MSFALDAHAIFDRLRLYSFRSWQQTYTLKSKNSGLRSAKKKNQISRTWSMPLWSSSQEQPAFRLIHRMSFKNGQERSFWSCLSATLVRRCVQRRSTSRVHGVPCTRPCLRPCLRPCTRSFMACTDRVHHDTMHTRHRKRWQQKFVGWLLLNSNNSFSRNRLVYVFGSRNLLGHNV